MSDIVFILGPANRRRHNSFDLPMTVDQDGFPQETESETDLRRTTVQKGQGKDKNNDEGIPCLILNQIDAIEVRTVLKFPHAFDQRRLLRPLGFLTANSRPGCVGKCEQKETSGDRGAYLRPGWVLVCFRRN
jgi:hypothetical protein